MDEDTARAVQSGRETAGAFFSAAQNRLQHVFIAFVVGMLGGILAMRMAVWPQLEEDLLARGANIITQTPFDVILLQVKIGFILGALTLTPVLLYHARDPLAERGLINDVPVARWKVVVVFLAAVGLFFGGVLYAYYLFFPIMFRFLAANAQQAGLAPYYSIIHWTQFILVLGLSFGVAAQLPLVMTALSYSGIVPYEVFRDYWKYAVVSMFGFGALFSPPEPFTQILWALPLIVLYGFSLYLSKTLVAAKRAGDEVDLGHETRTHWNHVLGVGFVAGVVGYLATSAGVLDYVDRGFDAVGSAYRFGGTDPLLVAGLLGGLGAVLAVLFVVYRAVVAAERDAARRRDPTAIDLAELDAEGVRAAPPEAFADLSEEEALAAANGALEAGHEEKAAVILDRYDEAEVAREEAAADDDERAGEESGVFERTTTGVVDAFTEEETTEEDIGGYYYDIRFVLDSIRSKAFYIFAVFIGILSVTFYWLYTGGIGVIRSDFLARLPADVPADNMNWPLTLHPVEALVFEMKVSTLFAAIITLPLVVYAAWPALRSRGVVGGDRRTVAVWAGSTLAALLGGLALGYTVVAPNVISWLVFDALQAEMVIAYRVKSFFWLVFLTTAGIGLLADIPISMLLFHYAGIVPYRAMRRHWRPVALGAFLFSAVLTPDSLYTMLIIAVPIVVAYWVGLGTLWLLTLGGRRDPAEPGPAAGD